MKKILILSTGGTFNKVYNPLTGELEIDKNSSALQKIALAWLCEFHILNTIGKDSLEMTLADRKHLVKTIEESSYEHILIIHGTDTLHLTAQYLDQAKLHKTIILTGAMVPYSIDPIEATANLASAYGYLQAIENKGIFIAMNGTIDNFSHVIKERSMGKFIPHSL